MKFTLLLFLGCFSISLYTNAQTDTIAKKKFHFGKTSDTSAGYAQAVLVDNILYVSGTVGRGETMAAQLKQIYSAIDRTLKAYGLSFQHVVKENLYTTDLEGVKANNEVRKAFYKGDYPAATWVQISRLFMPQAIVEVEVVAHLPKK